MTPTLITLSEEHARRNREKTTSTAGSSTSTSGDDLNLNHNQRLNDIGASKLRSTSRQTELAERFSNKLSDKIKKKGQANTQTQTSSSSSTTSASASANSTSTAAVPVVTRNVVQVEWVADGPEGCSKVDNTEFWGELVKWGNTNKKDSWEQCCEDCRTHQSEGGKPPCNVWVYCGASRPRMCLCVFQFPSETIRGTAPACADVCARVHCDSVGNDHNALVTRRRRGEVRKRI